MRKEIKEMSREDIMVLNNLKRDLGNLEIMYSSVSLLKSFEGMEKYEGIKELRKSLSDAIDWFRDCIDEIEVKDRFKEISE